MLVQRWIKEIMQKIDHIEVRGARVHNLKNVNVDIPLDCPGVTPAVLNPRHTWTTPEAYDEAAERLAAMFEEHASERYPDLDPVVLAAGPHPLAE